MKVEDLLIDRMTDRTAHAMFPKSSRKDGC
jgi:hypothetical protein